MKKALLALVAAMAAVTGAQADITTASGAIPLTDTDFTLALPMGAFSPVIPATAVVNSADITLSGEFLSTLTALNTSTSSNNVFSRTSTLNLDLLFGGSSLMSLAMDIWAVPQTTLGPQRQHQSAGLPRFRHVC
jgi:hypothetical protein